MDPFHHVKCQMAHIDGEQPLTVALSGGVDSIVLLHILIQMNTHPLSAIHVHHGIQAINDHMQIHCELFCKKHHIPLKTVSVQLPNTGNIEHLARQARYQAFAAVKTQYICLAHHQDDVNETLIMRLYQGRICSLPYSMPVTRTHNHQRYFRPMHALSKASIMDYALKHQLTWVEDPSNQNTDYLRNRIRARTTQLPELKAIAQSLQQYSKTLLKFEHTVIQHLLPTVEVQEKFNIMNDDAHPYLFRLWVLKHTHEQISENKAKEILFHFQSSKKEAQPLYKIRQHILRRYHAFVFFTPEIMRNQGVIYHEGACEMTFRSQLSGHSHFLKRLFQKNKIPQIYRNHLPIMIKNKSIVAVWGIYFHTEKHIKPLYWDNPPDFIEKYPFPLLKESCFQYTKPENTKDSYVKFNC